VVPDHVRTAGPQIVRLARLGGIELDEAQAMVADAVAGVGRDGRWAAFECVIFAPRQNLKTEFLLARILAGLFLLGEGYIVYSAHQVKTTTKTFRRLKRAIERSPQLGGRIARVSNRTGAETIELSTGQVLECVARSTNSGRGFTGDTIILDEAHELDADQLAAILPMLSTRPNPQVLYALSLGNESSTHLGVMRKRALSGQDPQVCWIEWSMADDDRIDDRAVWAACNPAYPARISMDYLEREWLALGSAPEVFARERLGKSQWPSDEAGLWQTISEDAWMACASPGASLGESPVRVAAAVAVPAAPAREWETWPGGIPPWIPRA
jgi:phage terminase large subunit-like protein